jgi:hypothetical protein
MVNDTESNVGGFPTATAHVPPLPDSLPLPPTGQDNQYEYFGFALDTMGRTMQGGTLAGPFDAQWDVGYVASYNEERRLS